MQEMRQAFSCVLITCCNIVLNLYEDFFFSDIGCEVGKLFGKYIARVCLVFQVTFTSICMFFHLFAGKYLKLAQISCKCRHLRIKCINCK